jgi:hypothetical protein
MIHESIDINCLIYFLVHRSSPIETPRRFGLALRPRPPSLLLGSQPPPPMSVLDGLSRLSRRCPTRRDDTSSLEARRRCIKLQKPPRLHSPFSFWRQHASRKSVTGESSAYRGRPGNMAVMSDTCHVCEWDVPRYVPAYQRSLRLSTAACASVSHSKRAYTLPMRWSPTLSHTYVVKVREEKKQTCRL